MTCIKLPIAALVLVLATSVAQAESNVGTVTLKEPATTSTQQGFFRQYALDHLRSGPAIVSIDRDDSVWVGLARSGKLARFSNGKLTLFPIGEESRPVGVVPDESPGRIPGTIWIAAAFDNKLVRYNYLTAEKQIIDLSSDAAWPFMIALAEDGTVWFSQRAGNRIGRVDPVTLAVQHYDLPTPSRGPAGLAIDPTDGHIWFAEGLADRIGELDPATGVIREYVMGANTTGMTSGPAGIAVTPDGHVWFAKLDGMLGHIAQDSDVIELVAVPENARRPAGIVVGPSGDIWSLALDGNCILQYKPDENHFVSYPMPSGTADLQPSVPPNSRTSRPFGLAFDSQGNLWVSEQYTGQLAVLDIAAPTVDILSPVGLVELADPLLTLRVLDRVSGVTDVRVEIDGRKANVRDGRLMLNEVLPGSHSLTVTGIDAAGLENVVTHAFTYQPSLPAAKTTVSELQPRDPAGSHLKEDILAMLGGPQPENGWEHVLLQAGQRLGAQADRFSGVDAATLRAVFDTAAMHAGERVVVQIVDTAPFFSKTELSLRAGGWVTWTYDPPIKGHRLETRLHRLRIAGTDVNTPVLKAGDSFSYRFETPGIYKILDERQPGAEATISVNKQ